MSVRSMATGLDAALGFRRVSARGFRRAAGNLARLGVLGGTLLTLWLVRGDAPIWLLASAVAVALAAVYAVDRRSGRFGIWAAYVCGFVLFALLRTGADDLGVEVKARYVVEADRGIFGGVLPQQWLQDRLYDPGAVGVVDVLTVVVVFSYFLLPHLVALVLWRCDLPAFRRYCPAVLLTVYTGLAVSALVPTAPPWTASEFTDAPPVARVVADVLDWNPEAIGPGSESAGLNPVAAMPSLHFAVTVLIVLALWPRRLLRRAALAYAAAMAFALVYGGEHYVVDLLAGAITAAVAWTAAARLSPRLASERASLRPARRTARTG